MAGTVADAAVCLCAPQLSVWSPVSNGLAGSVFNLLFCVLVVRARGNVSKSLYYEGAEMKSKDEIFDAVLGKEGGYVNHPDDKGGPTKWGITGKVARAHGYQGIFVT